MPSRPHVDDQPKEPSMDLVELKERETLSREAAAAAGAA
jgi:hypothetical protein